MRLVKFILPVFVILIFILSCSKGGNNTVVCDISGLPEIPDYPASTHLLTNDEYSSIAILGAFNLTISPDGSSAELTPKRSSTIGEAYIVSGMAFFENHLEIYEVKTLLNGDVSVGFRIEHPFEKGDPTKPPSSVNRLDLDVFDLALVINPPFSTPTAFLQKYVFDGILVNADGYTDELAELISGDAALPYKICYMSENNNRFEMGTDFQNFEIILKPTGGLAMELYLTMGYGFSAVRKDRLNPTYYVPEFNRKAPWRVIIHSPRIYDGSTGEYPVMIDIYDWNHGATVASVFPDPANTDHILSPSDIVEVTLEIPGMINDIVFAEIIDSDNNGWDDPISYQALIANDYGLPVGEYTGLVKVPDSRPPGTSYVGGETDTLVHERKGMVLEWYNIPGFVTYQIFNVGIVPHDPPVYAAGFNWGSEILNQVAQGNSVVFDHGGNIIVTGAFTGTVGSGGFSLTSNGERDAFLVKIDQNENILWALSWGGGIWDEGTGVAVDRFDNIFVTGFFQGQNVDFDPGSGEVLHHSELDSKDVFLSAFNPAGGLIDALTWGGGIWDEGTGVASTETGNIYVTGLFTGPVDFDPDQNDTFWLDSGSLEPDAFLSIFDPFGDFLRAIQLGGTDADVVREVIANNPSNVYITGSFSGTNIDFDPGAGQALHTAVGQADAYLLSLDLDGNYEWSRSWGGGLWDEGYGLAINYSNPPSIHVIGYFQGTVDFNPAGVPDLHTSNGFRDIFYVTYSQSGDYINPNGFFGGGQNDWGMDIITDRSNNITLTGMFNDTVDFDFGPGNYPLTSISGYDIFLTRYDPAGQIIWGQSWGQSIAGTLDDKCLCIVCNDSNHIYMTGLFRGAVDFDPGAGSDIRTSTGESDILVIKMSD